MTNVAGREPQRTNETAIGRAAGLTLYHGWLSSASRRVRLCLAEKGMPYESMPIDMGQMEHHSPEYLALNPNGVVPALRHHGRPLHESSTICEYLEDLQPEPALRPAGAYDRALMRNFIRYTDEKSLPNLLILNWSIALQPGASQWTDAQLAERMARVPSAERREAWTRIARKPYSDAEKATALANLLQLVDQMEAMLLGVSGGDEASTSRDSLEASPWLIGPRYTLADIAATPFIARIDELSPQALDASSHPLVHDWWRRVRARPSFAQANFERFDTALSRREASTS
ncbi:MAG: glutathione S-transferase family protein [Rhizobacter sp.]|nr:glutathione S-transferase family protein [Rhizobacter sp.]